MNLNFKKQKKLSVLILCGGKGKRLRPLTKDLPKPLIKIRKKEILGYIIDHLKIYGYNEILIASGYKHKLINKFFSNNYRECKIKVIETSPNDDIIKRIQSIVSFIKEDLLICYGDTLADIDLKKLYNFHIKNKCLATISSYEMRSDFGILKIKNQTKIIEKYLEKPALNVWFNIGYIILKKEIIKKTFKFKTFENFLKYLVKNKLAKSYKHRGLHITINTVKQLDHAKKLLSVFEKKIKTNE